MEETNFINQIKSLKGVKPNQHWVEKTERNILGKLGERKSFSFSWSPILAGAAAMLVILGGVAGYHYFPRSQQVAVAPVNHQIASLAPSLETLKNQINQVSESLEEMPETSSLSSTKKEVIQTTITKSQEIVERVKDLDKDKSLGSLLGDIEKERQRLMTWFTRQEVQKFTQEKEKGLLSPAEEKSLAEIQALIEQGRDDEAFNQLWISGFEK